MILFGEIFPEISLKQIRKAYPESFQNEVNKAMRHSLGFEHNVAINLERTGLSGELRFIPKLAGLESCSSGEELLLLLDCLGSDEINRCCCHLESIKQKGPGLTASLALLQATLDRILCL